VISREEYIFGIIPDSGTNQRSTLMTRCKTLSYSMNIENEEGQSTEAYKRKQ
jgi:hypothetical protein